MDRRDFVSKSLRASIWRWMRMWISWRGSLDQLVRTHVYTPALIIQDLIRPLSIIFDPLRRASTYFDILESSASSTPDHRHRLR
ncbi:Protein of unknown function [Pyronema omphalodes CBS 100304]|uniref:Uncharacterized protein n=1 Tax=Pyronema omphalodes (strain CBS 100304) TaxID=1076935 RepID=U4KYI6_PYROM|nr:Protein of unknown function [Pyronema omphalodes CBS 100304]